jgi:hypothetical protein
MPGRAFVRLPEHLPDANQRDPDGIGAAYLEMPDFDGPRDFLGQLAVTLALSELKRPRSTGSHLPHC